MKEESLSGGSNCKALTEMFSVRSTGGVIVFLRGGEDARADWPW